jgi:hypothetical protein
MSVELGDKKVVSQDFCIPSQNTWRLKDKIGDLNKRARKLHCSEITLTFHDQFEIRQVVINHESGESMEVVYQNVTVSGIAPCIEGWEFVATLETTYDDNGNISNIIRSVPGMTQDGELDNFRHSAPWCEHCKMNRRRNDTYLVRKVGGSVKQVGSTCLKDYTGLEDPMMIAAMAEMLALASEAAEACDELDDWGGSGQSKFLSLERYLEWVAMAMRTHGWVSRSKAHESYEPMMATADVALALQEDAQKAGRYGERKERPSDTDKERVQKALAWVHELDPGNSDYLNNLVIVCKGSVISFRHTGIAASVIMAYERAIQKELEHKVALISEYQGAVGDKVTVSIICTGEREISGNYGTTYLYTMVDANGNRYKWFSSKALLNQGEQYALKGTIKGYDEYNGVKATTLTRCKVL